MTKAIWNQTIIAESDETILIEGNHYFPPNSVKQTYLKAANSQGSCPWKGQSDYLNIEIDGQVNLEAAWTYPNPNEAASQIKGYFAFGDSVQVNA